MGEHRILIANRGEVAIRIARAVEELGMESVSVYASDEADALHVLRARRAVALPKAGPAAYLDIESLIAVAREEGCDALHPGYGFLSESGAFARACEAASLDFIGPRPETLELLGDKVRARALAAELGVSTLEGSSGAVDAEGAGAFFEGLGAGAAMVIKAVAGGGGRGMRVVRAVDDIEAAHTRCCSEAGAAFGNDAVYVERFISPARHLEVQIVGDGEGGVTHLWERECSLQRRHQKLVELAPSPGLDGALREAIVEAALRMARHVRYRGLGTFEFLVDAGGSGVPRVAFIEANPRLQVEHTVTEEVTGVDLVQLQLQLATGASLSELGLEASPPPPRGMAMQLRVNMERIEADGTPRPSSGTLRAFEAPGGPGLRVDAFGYAGYRTSPRYDSLLAKVVVKTPGSGLGELLRRARRALAEFRIDGVDTNLPFLRSLLAHPALEGFEVHTGFIEAQMQQLLAGIEAAAPAPLPKVEAAAGAALAGARVDAIDPLAVLAHGKSADAGALAGGQVGAEGALGEGLRAVRAPMQGTIVALEVEPSQSVRAGQPLVVMEAMKMEHVIAASESGRVERLLVASGDTVQEGALLAVLEPAEVAGDGAEQASVEDLERIRPDLQEAFDRHAHGLDENRPEAVAKRHKLGLRTARENVDDLVDAGSFIEYGPLVVAAQRRRRSIEDLRERTPADGLVAGVGSINAGLFGDERSQCAVLSYDYTVLAGTQGLQNHHKKDRLFELAERNRLPVVFFTEGGGGRPGDTDGLGVTGLDCLAFAYFGKLSGLVPLVGIATGRCFAGNAALLGCCDVVIATEGTNIGMGGPAMIEGGGLGVFRPEEVGPMSVQVKNGVVDVPVVDEAEAVAVAKRYLGYFQGSLADYECADQRLLRHVIPENRLRVYDIRRVIELLSDSDSVLELRQNFGVGMVTALCRVEGRPLGVIANNPAHLGGAIDRDAADKAARFMQLCDAFDLPILMLCDTPGIMVGPEAEKTALVRHVSRMFVTGASLSVPFFTIVLRKGYGLGAQLMAGGSFKQPFFTISWPTGEFGGMGLEGAVKLGFRKELMAIEDPQERKNVFDRMVEAAYDRGKGVNVASHFEFDEVIDPAESRRWIRTAMLAAPAPEPRRGKKRPCVDTW
ncbi:MAG: ATP-grasp domain-containing protein [Myxococcales bacterium]|nr:ATP-grasp domain-containing protein [Myxococcales bacterium]